MPLIETTIDGTRIEVERDRWALEVAREMGIAIPTMCHHPAMEPCGACRLCVVEVTRGKWTWLTTSCDLPIREGLSIRTDTPAVREARKMALELLWAEAPDAVEVQDLARAMGVAKPRFAPRGQGRCILCGLCVRVCQAILGQPAIGFVNRGVRREVGSPFDEPSEACIGCGACAAVCPTGHVLSVDRSGRRDLPVWKTVLEMAACRECGRPYAPLRQLEHVRGRLPQHVAMEEICPDCRRSRTVRRVVSSARLETDPIGRGKGEKR